MTREDAINIMKVIVHMLEEKYDTDRVEDAVDMAIKALEQEPCADCISRQAVIDCFKKWQPYMATRLHEFEKELFDLPSVNPQVICPTHGIDCKDCPAYEPMAESEVEE